MRRRAIKRVDKLIQSLVNGQESLQLEINHEDCFNIETSSWCEQLQASSDGEGAEVLVDRFVSDEEEMDCNDTCSDTVENLSDSLADWACEFSISLMALSSLLCILHIHHPSLPKDGRTLLKTKNNIQHRKCIRWNISLLWNTKLVSKALG